MLDIIEHHVRLILEVAQNIHIEAPIALEFLLQTLAPQRHRRPARHRGDLARR